jgi:hypothetical protein
MSEIYQRFGRQGGQVFEVLFWLIVAGGPIYMALGWFAGMFLEIILGSPIFGVWYPSSVMFFGLGHAWIVAVPVFLAASAVAWMFYFLFGCSLLLYNGMSWLQYRHS